jgi:C1A family cysteine protease
MSENKQAYYGWRPDLPDHRDVRYSLALMPKETLAVPPQVDLSITMPPVQDQGPIGSCTAHAALAVMGHNALVQQRPFVLLSRLFAYYNARALEGVASADVGATLRGMIQGLARNGVCAEDTWLYDTDEVTIKPSKRAYAEAVNNRIRLYARLNDLSDMLMCLAAGFPFVFGFAVYSSFESDEVAASGAVNMPTASERPVGGHAVCAVGYDQEARRFIVRNSWGDDWGQKGYFTIPFDYLADRSLSDDFWTIRL